MYRSNTSYIHTNEKHYLCINTCISTTDLYIEHDNVYTHKSPVDSEKQCTGNEVTKE